MRKPNIFEIYVHVEVASSANFKRSISNQPLKYQPSKMVKRTKQFVGKLPTNYLSVFNFFVGLAL